MPESAFADAHFFDVYLKGEGTFPKTPELSDWRSHGGPMIVLGNRCWSWRTSSTEMNGWSAYAGVKQGSYFAAKPIAKTGDWQTIEIALTNLKPLDDKSAAPGSWQFATELGLVAQVRGKRQAQTLAGGEWPAPRQLRNQRWVSGEYPKQLLQPGAKVSEEEYRRTFQAEDGQIRRTGKARRDEGAMTTGPAIF